MTKGDVVKLISAISVLYPKYKPAGKEELELKINMYFSLLRNVEKEVAWLSLQKWAVESSFPPTIHDLLQKSLEIKNTEYRLTVAEAWKQVMNAIEKYGYYQEEEAMKVLDPVVREIVKSMGFKQLCVSENNMADRAHFIKLFETHIKSKKKEALLPIHLQKMISRVKKSLCLPEAKEE